MLVLVLIATALTMLVAYSADELECVLGDKITVELGDGVTLQSCSWEKTPGNFVRVGPLQLVRNSVLILRLETDRAGRLQGKFTSWNDDGLILEEGQYRDGQKEGDWHVVDEQGNRQVVTYRAGIVQTP
jgi:antitoxin component YwqK of YwqJK toxin-antitoxin module